MFGSAYEIALIPHFAILFITYHKQFNLLIFKFFPWISDAVRQAHGLSADLLQVGDYDKLEKALISGLPNEVDFVFNVCTLLSNEGRHCLKLEKSQHIIPLLLAHVGIFDEEGMCF